MCSEDASLWVKFHSIPYLLSHRGLLTAFFLCDFLADLVKMFILAAVVCMLRVELAMLGGLS